MPEPNKATLKSQLTAEVMGALIQRPRFTGGQSGRWRAGQLELSGRDAAVGGRGARFLSRYVSSSVLRWERPMVKEHPNTRNAWRRCVPCYAMTRKGWIKCIGALSRLRTRYPRRQAIHKTLAYFREHRHRMRYASYGRTTCPLALAWWKRHVKRLVSQRLKRSGMRWRTEGGQAILTFRALCQSERFERAWSLLGETYKRSVTLPRKVLAFSKRR